MNILLPKAITPDSFGPATSIPELDAARGEVAWVGSGNYKVGDRRVYERKIYQCVKDHTGTATTPDKMPAEWLFKEPTNRWCPFDQYLFTKARAVQSLTYELKGVFADGLALYGLEGDSLSITITAGPGGANLIPPINADLWQQAYGEWEYLFGDLQRGDHYVLRGIPLHPDQRIKITVRRTAPTAEAAVGYISVGNHKTLLAPSGGFSAVEDGAEVTTKDYGYTKDNADGTYEDIEGRKAKNISLSVVVASDQAPLIDSLLTQIAGKVVAVEVSKLAKFSHLATVGKVTGTVRSSGGPTARAEIQIKGNV
ncbi:MAG: hypothetical protein PBV86_12265 [Delftia lacustris]|jgi:hypothetical protein|uniref:hypothetical protein n=1 Tax=Delftia TaxID=80865 RepID=UPI00259D1A25|nr:hypothetical protein [Delftia sp.]